MFIVGIQGEHFLEYADTDIFHSVVLYAIFPSFANIPDKMGPKSALNSGGMICFFVYWVINCAFLLIPVPKMRVLVYIKVAVYYVAAFAMLGWTVSLAGGSVKTPRTSTPINGPEKSWVIVKFLFLGLASCGTFISNAADLQRYARKPNDVILGQVISFPLSNLLVAILGNVIASASQRVFGELIWNPLTFLERLMEGDRYTSANRAGCAFIGLGFVYASVFSAIFENSISAGNDIAALCPRYITIKRGFFICAAFTYAICPWYLLATASVFINFLSSYQIFLSAIAGILICDYYLLRRGHLHVPSLYSSSKESLYHFLHGWNLRAFVAYLISIAPSFYGFLNQLGVKAPLSIQRFYYVAYPTSLLIAFGVYCGSSLVFPVKGMTTERGWKEPEDYVGERDEGQITIEGVAVDVHDPGMKKGGENVISKAV